ncbi:FecR domain-containing protein [Variovorax sp. CY25R-8]|nr:FecR domain-containing protein [Variovorax sp.]MBS74760.1 iron dicitrate transport regulator FecR [Variovorax sp.]MCT8178276.1 FecR domain-containing protein [Variovorax sp. CY25R-8]
MPAADAGAGRVRPAGAPVDPRLLDEAAQWLARLHAGRPSAADLQGCEAWRNQSPEHQRVWQSAEQLSRRFGAVPAAVGMPVLDRRRDAAGRRALLRTVALLLGVPSAAWIGYRTLPWQAIGADVSTATGERRHLTLPDGSGLDLDTASAVSLDFDDTQRLLRHRAGEILIETAPDPRPFLVQTAHASLRALGTRFVVRSDDARGRLGVLEGAVEIRPARNPGAPVIVPAGRQAFFSATSVSAPRALPAGADAWARGVLYAEEMRLADFAAELARYRSGALHCDPAAAEIRVSGAFQLDDTDRILELLARTLPVRIESRTRYWVTIAAR